VIHRIVGHRTSWLITATDLDHRDRALAIRRFWAHLMAGRLVRLLPRIKLDVPVAG